MLGPGARTSCPGTEAWGAKLPGGMRSEARMHERALVISGTRAEHPDVCVLGARGARAA